MSLAGIIDDPETRTRIIPESRRADGSIRKERKVKPGFTPAEDIGKFRPSRVIRAEEEARQQGRAKIPGYESPSVEGARRAFAGASLSTVTSGSADAKSSDRSWRRGPGLDAAAENVNKSGVWRSRALGTGSSSLDKGASYGDRRSRESTKRGDSAEQTKKMVEVPDDWEQEVGMNAKDVDSEPVKEMATTAEGEEKDTGKYVKPPQSEEDVAKRVRSLSKKIRTTQSLKERQSDTGEALLPEQQVKVDLLEDMVRDLKAMGIEEEVGKAAV
ncbi:hypothetical protein CBS101457_000821 [Exobasidium rhododendri]|nr:hypothetical protein CBS101457_000821 [Exobasidium rhododendri]